MKIYVTCFSCISLRSTMFQVPAELIFLLPITFSFSLADIMNHRCQTYTRTSDALTSAQTEKTTEKTALALAGAEDTQSQ